LPPPTIFGSQWALARRVFQVDAAGLLPKLLPANFGVTFGNPVGNADLYRGTLCRTPTNCVPEVTMGDFEIEHRTRPRLWRLIGAAVLGLLAASPSVGRVAELRPTAAQPPMPLDSPTLVDEYTDPAIALESAPGCCPAPCERVCPCYGPCACCGPCGCCGCEEPWHWQWLPDGLIYRSYIAGPKESRFGSVWFHEKDQGLLWDIALGGRVGLLRYGTSSTGWPEGWQLDIEGAAFPRLDPEDGRDLVSSDFRFGIPLTYGEGPYQTKFAYYHLSSHLGDEFMLRYPNVPRINYTRDAFVYGNSYYWTRDLRIYGEVEYAFGVDGGAEPWAVQFGFDLTPPCPMGIRGAPFAAVNAYLREEVDFGGTFTAQTGWQWRGGRTGKLLRIGLHFLTGKSPQFEFFNQSETQFGGGIWYDY
jgi:hypothetical protein